jgi:hypothetical protein
MTKLLLKHLQQNISFPVHCVRLSFVSSNCILSFLFQCLTPVIYQLLTLLIDILLTDAFVETLSDEDVESLDRHSFGMYDQDGADVLLWHAPNLVDLNFMKFRLYEKYVESKYWRLSRVSPA